MEKEFVAYFEITILALWCRICRILLQQLILWTKIHCDNFFVVILFSKNNKYYINLIKGSIIRGNTVKYIITNLITNLFTKCLSSKTFIGHVEMMMIIIDKSFFMI